MTARETSNINCDLREYSVVFDASNTLKFSLLAFAFTVTQTAVTFAYYVV